MSERIEGCVAPRPSPSRNEIMASSGTVLTIGKHAYAKQAMQKVAVIMVHSRRCRESHGSATRTRKVATAKLARMSPMVEALRWIELPYTGTAKVKRSQAL